MTVLFTLLLIAPAATQEPTADPLAYTPTGDALWDTYAQALLEYLDEAPYASGTWGLPDELLDSWERNFGGDPRYWQLLYWNATQKVRADEKQEISPIEFLEYGADLGVADPVTKMLLYQHHEDSLQRFWDYYPSKTPEQKVEFGMPNIPSGRASQMWFHERETLLRDNLVADCPNESWAWYASAMKRFDYGDWEAGLDDMSRGNEASNNRVPLPFPASFVVKRVALEQHCGSEIAAGIVFEGMLYWPLKNFIRLKDHVINQEIRLAMGAQFSELKPWQTYTCRFGSMEGANAIHWLVALVMRNMQIKYLLLQTPESFTIDQREALWLLNVRARKIRDLVSYEIEMAQLDSFDEHKAINAILLNYGITMELDEVFPLEFTIESSTFGLEPELESALLNELKRVQYQAYYHFTKPEYGTIYRKAKERFDLLATFDFETFSWPESN